MFEPIRIDARTDSDGKLHLDLPGVPPGSAVQVTVSEPLAFDRALWEAHVDRIAGSIADLEAPERRPAREVEPL